MYATQFGENEVPKEDLSKIERQLEELIKDIESSGIDAEFKKVILESLLNLQYYIKRYELFGISEIRDALNKLAGILVLNVYKPDNVTKNENSVFKGLLSLVTNVNQIVELTKNVGSAVQIVEPFIVPMLEQLIK